MRVLFTQDGCNHIITNYLTEEVIDTLIATCNTIRNHPDNPQLQAEKIANAAGNVFIEDEVTDISMFEGILDESWGGRL